jgi:tRNA nucleotidyltransferase (CCA-adding enzyme)
VRQIGGPARTYGRFGTATIEIDGVIVDLAQTRTETYPSPGALPVVRPADLTADLWRRDFTVNAIALPLTGSDRGRLVAADRAIEDLEGRRLRVLHHRSFLDDPTRLLRMARYRSRLGLEVERETLGLARQAIESRALETVSGSRIGNELRLLAAEPDPVRAWQELTELGLDEAIRPGFGLHDPELARRALDLLPAVGRTDALLLALAVGGIEPGERAPLLDHLAFPAPIRDTALRASHGAAELRDALLAASSPSEIARAVGSGENLEGVAIAGALGAEAPARQWLEELRQAQTSIGGQDLLEAGVKPGPAIGAGLAAARAALLDGQAPTREEQLQEALRAARAHG